MFENHGINFQNSGSNCQKVGGNGGVGVRDNNLKDLRDKRGVDSKSMEVDISGLDFVTIIDPKR